jgi:hypothetical protein
MIFLKISKEYRESQIDGIILGLEQGTTGPPDWIFLIKIENKMKIKNFIFTLGIPKLE